MTIPDEAAFLAAMRESLPNLFMLLGDDPEFIAVCRRAASEWWTPTQLREALAANRRLAGHAEFLRRAEVYRREGVEPFSCSPWRLMLVRVLRRFRP